MSLSCDVLRYRITKCSQCPPVVLLLLLIQNAQVGKSWYLWLADLSCLESLCLTMFCPPNCIAFLPTSHHQPWCILRSHVSKFVQNRPTFCCHRPQFGQFSKYSYSEHYIKICPDSHFNPNNLDRSGNRVSQLRPSWAIVLNSLADCRIMPHALPSPYKVKQWHSPLHNQRPAMVLKDWWCNSNMIAHLKLILLLDVYNFLLNCSSHNQVLWLWVTVCQ